jgi:hypothetical protein
LYHLTFINLKKYDSVYIFSFPYVPTYVMAKECVYTLYCPKTKFRVEINNEYKTFLLIVLFGNTHQARI